jgi:hypothetical protein
MKQEMKVLVSHESVEWYTPPAIIEAARLTLGEIDLDPASCAKAQENVKALHYFYDGALENNWWGRVYLNGPYSKTGSRSNQEIWATKLEQEYNAYRVQSAILLVKTTPGYKWFEALWDKYPACFFRERVSFLGEDMKEHGQAKHGTTVFYLPPKWGDVRWFEECFAKFGRIILP